MKIYEKRVIHHSCKVRTYGKAYVGSIKEDGTYSGGSRKYTIDWAYEHDITSSSALFAYRCMTELVNGNIGILYETSPDSTWSTGLQAMFYIEFTVAELITNAAIFRFSRDTQ